MEKVYGKVIKVLPYSRIIKVLTKDKLVSLYMSRKFFKDFGPYFVYKPYIYVNTSGKKYVAGVNALEVSSFIKIVKPSRFKGQKNVYYDVSIIRKGVYNLLINPVYKLFIDLEFTLPSYYQNQQHISEIVQYGIVLVDETGKIVFEDARLVKPLKPYSLNMRTLKFISKKYEDFNRACTYKQFYKLLVKLIKQYDPKVIAWGKSDMLALEQSFKINNCPDLDIRNRYINLMQVIKNYYNLKNDLGLFTTYQEMAHLDKEEQSHDALEDAMVAREIYEIFKHKVEEDNNEGLTV